MDHLISCANVCRVDIKHCGYTFCYYGKNKERRKGRKEGRGGVWGSKISLKSIPI